MLRKQIVEFLRSVVRFVHFKGKRILDGIHANSAVILAPATVALSVVAWLQWKTLEKTDQTLKATLAANQSNERAWLAPARAEIQGTVVSIYFGNVGRSPTLRAQIVLKEIVTSLHTAADMSATEKQVKEFCPQKPSKQAVEANDWGLFLPNEAVNSFFPSKPDAYVRHFTVKTKASFIVGCISYETAGETHHTAFCFAQEDGAIDRCRGSETGYFGNYAD
jgi:hypothetical protein